MSLLTNADQSTAQTNSVKRSKLAENATTFTTFDKAPEDIIKTIFCTLLPNGEAEVTGWKKRIDAAQRITMAAKVLAVFIKKHTPLNQLVEFIKAEKNTDTLLHVALTSKPSCAPFYFALEILKKHCRLHIECINDPEQQTLDEYINSQHPENNRTPLEVAINCGLNQPFMTLLKLGANPANTGKPISVWSGCDVVGTPLAHCVYHERFDMAQALLNLKQPNGQPSLASITIDLTCRQRVMNQPEKIQHSALFLAVAYKHLKMAKLLLANGAKFAHWDHKKQAWGGMIFDFIREGKTDVVAILLSRLSANISGLSADDYALKQHILKELDEEIKEYESDIKIAQAADIDPISFHTQLVNSPIFDNWTDKKDLESYLSDIYNGRKELDPSIKLPQESINTILLLKKLLQLGPNLEIRRYFIEIREKLKKSESLDQLIDRIEADDLYHRAQGDAARALAEKVLSEKPDDRYALLLLSKCHRSREEYEQADSYLHRCLSLYPDFYLAHNYKEEILYNDAAAREAAWKEAQKQYQAAHLSY